MTEHREGAMTGHRGREAGHRGLTGGDGKGRWEMLVHTDPTASTLRSTPENEAPPAPPAETTTLPAPALLNRVSPTMLGTQGSSSPFSWATTWDPEGTNPRRQCKTPCPDPPK